MTVIQSSVAMPTIKRVVTKSSQYDFSKLRPGTEDCFLEFDYTNAEKGRGRLTSATVAWRKRTGSTQRFTVREVEVSKDGVATKALGVWALAPAKVEAPAAEAAAPVAETAAA